MLGAERVKMVNLEHCFISRIVKMNFQTEMKLPT